MGHFLLLLQLRLVHKLVSFFNFYTSVHGPAFDPLELILLIFLFSVYIVAVQNLPFIENMEKRIQSATALLDGSLGHCFVNGLEHRDATAIYNCLRAYAAIDNTAAAEEIFRTTIFTPLVQKIIPYGQSQVVDGPSSDELEEDYQQIKQCIKHDCKFLLEISSSGLEATRIYFLIILSSDTHLFSITL